MQSGSSATKQSSTVLIEGKKGDVVEPSSDNVLNPDCQDYEDVQIRPVDSNENDQFIDEDPPSSDIIDVIDVIDAVSSDEIIQNKTSRSVRDLHTFLNNGNFITEKGDQNTNIINVSEKRTYNIPDAYLQEFFIMLENCRKEGCVMHFSERQETMHISHSGIMIDFDRYQKTRDVQLTEYHFETLCLRIVGLLKEFLDFTSHIDSNGRMTVRLFIIRKPAILLHDKGIKLGYPVYKDGFHILIPEIQVVKGLKKHLFMELINRNIISGVFKDITNMDAPENMLDKMSASNPVHFFGSSKPLSPAYILTHAYEITFDIADESMRVGTIDIEGLIEGKMPVKKNRGAGIGTGTGTGSGTGTGTNKNVPLVPNKINLIYELALGYYTEEFQGESTWLKKIHYNYKSSLETKIQLAIEKTTRGIIPEDEIISNENSVDILTMGNAEAKYLKMLLGLLDQSYATEYDKWFKVICALAHTSAQYKALAIWFSQRVPDKWSPAEVDRIWNEALASRGVKNPVTKRSIIFWAQQSSPQKFRELEKENYVEMLAKYVYDNEGRVEHAMVARVIHSMIREKFVVDVGFNEKSGRVGYIWFEFVMQGQSMRRGEIFKWRKELDPDNIHMFISEQLPKVYAEQAERIRKRKDGANNEAEAKFLVNVEKTFRQYMSKLSNDGFQKGVINQAQYRFRQRGFCDDLDQDEDLIGVGNGVLKIGLEPKLIKGFHEYKVSQYTEVEYIDRPFDPYSGHKKKLLQWASDIFPEPDVNLFMWIHAATGLDFCESACILLLLVGGGQNGKSSWAKMIHNTLGNQYCAVGKSSLLTSPFERGESANSAQMQMRGKRWFYFDEFNKSEEINVARMKSLVNPGWQSGRDLREKQTIFKNTCNPIALSNYDFTFPANTNDHGTWRRIYYYRNKAKFSKRPNKENIYEKLADDNWITTYPNDPSFKTAMLECLVYHYQIYCRDYNRDLKKIPVPTIMRETEDFRNRQDTVNRFITQMIVKSPNADPLSLTTLSTKYCEWYNRNVKMVSHSSTEVQSSIENSRLSSSFEFTNSGVKLLFRHRIKLSAEEPLQPGEEELIQIKQTDGETIGVSVGEDGFTNVEHVTLKDEGGNVKIVPCTMTLQGLKLDMPDENKYIKDLIRNAPIHLQKPPPAPEVDLGKIIEDALNI